jgi:hypothetical protein
MNAERMKHSPSMTETVKGDPIQVAGHELVPLVRITRHVRRRAFVGSEGVGGGGWGYVYMRPIAILDGSGAGERRLPVRSETIRSMVWLSVVFLVVPLVAVLLIYLSHTSDDEAS